jgi:hypothetical protein
MGTSGIFDENLLFGTIFRHPVDVLCNNRFDPGLLEALCDAQWTYGQNSTVLKNAKGVGGLPLARMLWRCLLVSQ